MTTLAQLVSQPAERIARLDATTRDACPPSADYSRTDARSNEFDNRPTWDNWSNR
jgi:hypothetical protein